MGAAEPGRRTGDMRFITADDVETQVFDWGTLVLVCYAPGAVAPPRPDTM